ncbi:MDR family MFS transporter [Dictyobacter aurantiacus]|uniref:MFS transporter n=1 Tax=Dictyobacter aurantiacus TaxID=1936993 RepID=A0A401ZD11_9CHLR|nr:MDR family MFS transporter [Dictyobacter aurantiacus]GCE04735.1 MFS transporter [Dictyobacter aurantiacus]
MKQEEKTSQSDMKTDDQRVGSSGAPAPTGKEAAPQLQSGKWQTLLVVAIGVFMATLDSSIVNISLPAIARNFGVPLSGAVEWVIIAYLVVTAAVLLTAGRLADMVGRKSVWLTGLVVFTGSSALCGLAPSLTFLIAARALQGFGGALLMAVSPAMLTAAFPSHERGRALGLNAIIVALGVSIGPILGGFITGYFSWRWIFYVNLPIGILGLIATLTFIKEKVQRRPGRFDPLGAILLAVGLASLTAGLSFAQELGWGSPPILALLIVGVLALIILPFVELRVPNPAIVLSLLKNRVFTSALLSLIISFLALFAVSFMLPFYLEELRGFSTELSGLLLTPLPLTIAFIAPFSGSLADRIGTRWLAAGGLAIAGLGLVFVSFLNAHTSIWGIVWPLLVTGIGQSIFQSPNNSALLGAAPPQHQGSASGFLATARTMGQSLSIALAGAIFSALGGAAAGGILASGHAGGQMAQLQHTFVYSFHQTFIVCACIAVVGVLASLVRGKETPRAKSR